MSTLDFREVGKRSNAQNILYERARVRVNERHLLYTQETQAW